MKNPRRVLVLTYKGFLPPENAEELKAKDDIFKYDWVTEYNVITTLKKLKHEVLPLEVESDLSKIRNAVEEFKPHIVYNLMELFDGESTMDQNVVSYLQLLKVPFTGCNPRGLILARDKALTKKILNYHRVKVPKFFVFPKNKKVKLPKEMQYPLIVKCLREEASFGISQASVVNNEDKLMERVEFIHTNIGDDVIVEQFIEGRELYCGVMGNYRLETFPVRELIFENVEKPEKEVYTYAAKFNTKVRKDKGVKTERAKLSPELEKRIHDVCKKVYRALYLNGYARIDIRMDKDENIYVLEANPNPDIAEKEDFASGAKHAGKNYKKLINKILDLGISWHKVLN